MEKERKMGKKENTELQNPKVVAEFYNSNKKVWMNIHTYIHTHKQNLSSPTKIR